MQNSENRRVVNQECAAARPSRVGDRWGEATDEPPFVGLFALRLARTLAPPSCALRLFATSRWGEATDEPFFNRVQRAAREDARPHLIPLHSGIVLRHIRSCTERWGIFPARAFADDFGAHRAHFVR